MVMNEMMLKNTKEFIERQRKKHRQYVRFDETCLDDPSFWTSNPKAFWNPPRGASGLEARPLLKVSHDESIFRLFGFIHYSGLSRSGLLFFLRVREEVYMLAIS